MPAVTTELIAESVGALLRQAREEAGLTVRAVSDRTKIPEKYLIRFEDDAHHDLADDVYTKIYLKAYSKFLGFETAAFLEHYRKERTRYGIPAAGMERPDRHPQVAVDRKFLVVTPKVVQLAAIGVLAFGLVGWLGKEVKAIIAPPAINLVSPQDGFVTYDRSIAIDGTTEREVALSINGKQLSPDDTGKFHDTIDLQEGMNVISITGAKKHSKSSGVTRRVIVLPKTSADAPTDPNVIDAATLPSTSIPARAKVIAPAPGELPASVTTAVTPASAPAPEATPATNGGTTENPLGIQF